MKFYNDIRDIVGNTPLLKLNNISPDENVNIFAKLEYLNPGGSIKDRIGLQIIEDAEKEGLLKPGYTIIEATAGNTGIGLALAAFEKGYKLIIVIPEKFSIEKQTLMRALGAELIITPSEEGIEGAVEKANALLKSIPNSFIARQFENESNIRAHRKTGKEIYDALDGKIDILVAGAIKQAYKAKGKTNIVVILPDRSDRYFSQNLYDFNMKLSDFRFNALFDDWADSYDETIEKTDGEYCDVFKNYNEILNETVKHISKFKGAKVLDIGAGTGNLTDVAAKAGYNVVGIEPNSKMREIASNKYPFEKFLSGTFLSLPINDNSVDAIINSYAFHHLTDEEKIDAVKLFKSKLKKDGIVVIADTIYSSEEYKQSIIEEVSEKNYTNLLHDLKTEFYTTQEVLTNIFEKEGFKVSYQQMNKFVWILTAKLQ